jgi:hypothetical protein
MPIQNTDNLPLRVRMYWQSSGERDIKRLTFMSTVADMYATQAMAHTIVNAWIEGNFIPGSARDINRLTFMDCVHVAEGKLAVLTGGYADETGAAHYTIERADNAL